MSADVIVITELLSKDINKTIKALIISGLLAMTK